MENNLNTKQISRTVRPQSTSSFNSNYCDAHNKASCENCKRYLPKLDKTRCDAMCIQTDTTTRTKKQNLKEKQQCNRYAISDTRYCWQHRSRNVTSFLDEKLPQALSEMLQTTFIMPSFSEYWDANKDIRPGRINNSLQTAQDTLEMYIKWSKLKGYDLGSDFPQPQDVRSFGSVIWLKNEDDLDLVTKRIADRQTDYQKIVFVSAGNHITNLHDNFLSNCFNLQSVHFVLPGVTTVGDNFLSTCYNLTEVNFQGLSSLETVGDSWLSNCETLTEISFQGLSSLKTVQDNWFSNCSNLTTINFKGLGSLQTVENNWLTYNSNLTEINFQGLSSLQRVGDSWLFSCHSLRKVNFQSLKSLETVGDDWLSTCYSLTDVNCQELSSLHTVGKCWLFYCPTLTEINFQELTLLDTVGCNWMKECDLLHINQITLPPNPVSICGIRLSQSTTTNYSSQSGLVIV